MSPTLWLHIPNAGRDVDWFAFLNSFQYHIDYYDSALSTVCCLLFTLETADLKEKVSSISKTWNVHLFNFKLSKEIFQKHLVHYLCCTAFVAQFSCITLSYSNLVHYWKEVKLWLTYLLNVKIYFHIQRVNRKVTLNRKGLWISCFHLISLFYKLETSATINA